MTPISHPYLEAQHEVRVIADCDGFILGVNAPFCELLGYSAETVCGRNFVDFLWPMDDNLSIGALDPIVAGHRLKDYRNTYLGANDILVEFVWTTDEVDNRGRMFMHGKVISKHLRRA